MSCSGFSQFVWLAGVDNKSKQPAKNQHPSFQHVFCNFSVAGIRACNRSHNFLVKEFRSFHEKSCFVPKNVCVCKKNAFDTSCTLFAKTPLTQPATNSVGRLLGRLVELSTGKLLLLDDWENPRPGLQLVQATGVFSAPRQLLEFLRGWKSGIFAMKPMSRLVCKMSAFKCCAGNLQTKPTQTSPSQECFVNQFCTK